MREDSVSNSDDSSFSSRNSSSPLSIEYSRWMVVMQTLLAGSMEFRFRCWTVYSSVNLRLVYGETYCWNSLRVCLPRLLRSTKKRMRRTLPNLMRRYEKETAV